MSASQKLDLPDFKPNEILELFLAKDFEAIATQYLAIFDYFEQCNYRQRTKPLKTYIDQFLGNFFYVFSQQVFLLPEEKFRAFIRYNKIIANLAAISSFQSTDSHLKILNLCPENLGQILTLYSPRNSFDVDYNKIFTINSDLACYWYSYIFQHYSTALANEVVSKKLYFHATYDHPALTHFYNYSDLYYGSTYISPDLDRTLKYRINFSLQQTLDCQKNIEVETIPKSPKKRIAIVSSSWNSESKIHQKFFYYIAALAYEYELTLIFCGEKSEIIDRELFKQVIFLKFKNNSLDVQQLYNQQFSLIYFTDIGLTAESILLANLRFASIQCCGLGYRE